MTDEENEYNTAFSRAAGPCSVSVPAVGPLAADSAGKSADPDIHENCLKNSEAESQPAENELLCRTARRDLLLVLFLWLLLFVLSLTNADFAWRWALETAAAGAAVFWGGRALLGEKAASGPGAGVFTVAGALAACLTSLLRLCGAEVPSFAVAGVLAVLLSLAGRYLKTHLLCRADHRLAGLYKELPRTARVAAGDGEVLTPACEVGAGSSILVAAGERVPLDGVVAEGTSSVDESLLTGEAMPAVKDVGSDVVRGAMNLSGPLKIKTTGTPLTAQAQGHVPDAGSGGAPVLPQAGRTAFIFASAAALFAVAGSVLWLCFYDEFASAVAPLAAMLPWAVPLSSRLGAAASVFAAALLVASPCALELSVAAASSAGTGEALRHGVVVRDPEALRRLPKVDFALLDKTGTLTKGTPCVVAAELREEARGYVLELESASRHPLACAVTAYLGGPAAAGACGCGKPDRVFELPGEGLCGIWGDDEWRVVRLRGVSGKNCAGRMPASFAEVRKNGAYMGCFTVADPVRADSGKAVSCLRTRGAELLLATGDNMDSAIESGRAAGIDSIRWEVCAADKLALVREAQGRGRRVLAAGDGFNDAAALRAADVGVAMAGGAKPCVFSAGLVIEKDGLSKISEVFKIAEKTVLVLRQNIFWAFAFSAFALPFAACGLLPPWAAGAVLAADAAAAVANSLRVCGSAGEKAEE